MCRRDGLVSEVVGQIVVKILEHPLFSLSGKLGIVAGLKRKHVKDAMGRGACLVNTVWVQIGAETAILVRCLNWLGTYMS